MLLNYKLSEMCQFLGNHQLSKLIEGETNLSFLEKADKYNHQKIL
jgi:hypothetical protein